MATYSSYKKITPDNLDEGIVTSDKLVAGAGMPRGTFFVYSERGMKCQQCANDGGCVCQACGRCCQWTVPTGVTTATFEIWSGGGGGPGTPCCNCHQDGFGGAGGNYAQKTIETTPGCQYTICAGGSWPCSKSHTCTAGQGCKSYVTGYNLDNFCVNGACGGIVCLGDEWRNKNVTNCGNCGVCGIYGADFGMTGSIGNKSGSSMCYCHGRTGFTGQAPMIGRTMTSVMSQDWCTCGCYVNWPAGGGAPGVVNQCGNIHMCCAGGSGQGGSGIVKVTFA